MPWNVGIIGAGTIAAAYLRAIRTFTALEAVAIADLDLDRARARADAFGVPRACSVDELLRDPQVDVVLNLTVPAAHAEVSGAALAAGKHVYSEKPLATRRADGEALVAAAAERSLRLGCAPDTVLGPGLRTARAALDAGEIGRPLAATAMMASRGPDAWHPDPGFFYQPGAGPLFDFGPYYLSALVQLLGPVAAVAADAVVGLPERVVGSGPKVGTRLRPTAPTHVAALLAFEAGPRATLLTRLKEAPFPFVSTLHLTTLVGERSWDEVAEKKQEARLIRFQQIKRLLDLVRSYIIEKKEPLIVAGDFNAMEDEDCIKHLLGTVPGFLRLIPENDGPTHPDVERAVDHIFFYPRERLVSYTCRIDTSDLSRRASDHLPVAADLEIK